jgi:hypothetical protein
LNDNLLFVCQNKEKYCSFGQSKVKCTFEQNVKNKKNNCKYNANAKNSVDKFKARRCKAMSGTHLKKNKFTTMSLPLTAKRAEDADGNLLYAMKEAEDMLAHGEVKRNEPEGEVFMLPLEEWKHIFGKDTFVLDVATKEHVTSHKRKEYDGDGVQEEDEKRVCYNFYEADATMTDYVPVSYAAAPLVSFAALPTFGAPAPTPHADAPATNADAPTPHTDAPATNADAPTPHADAPLTDEPATNADAPTPHADAPLIDALTTLCVAAEAPSPGEELTPYYVDSPEDDSTEDDSTPYSNSKGFDTFTGRYFSSSSGETEEPPPFIDGEIKDELR